MDIDFLITHTSSVQNLMTVCVCVWVGGGDTIPCNWKEMYRGYKLSATCIVCMHELRRNQCATVLDLSENILLSNKVDKA